MATKGIRYGNKLVSLGGKGIRPPIPVQDGLVIWIDPANRKSVPANFDNNISLSCLVSDRVSTSDRKGKINGNFIESTPGTFGVTATERLQFAFGDDAELSSTFSNGSFTIEEWFLVENQNYPESHCGGVISTEAYALGHIGFEWNHGIQTPNYTRVRMITQSNNDILYNINHDVQYQTDDLWYHRVIICDRDLSSVSLYLNGDFQGSGSIAGIGNDSLYDGGGIYFGTVSGWTHEGKRGPTRVYNKALSQAEITENYNAEKHRY